MRGVDGVIDVHDLHIWSLGSQAHALSCHVLIDDVPPSASEVDSEGASNRCLCERFSINHSTIQFEHVRCEEPCVMVKKKETGSQELVSQEPFRWSLLKQQRRDGCQISSPDHPGMHARRFDGRELHLFRGQPYRGISDLSPIGGLQCRRRSRAV